MKRFFYVTSKRSKTLHKQYGSSHSEGLTACGRVISKGWFWFKNAPKKPHCKGCESV